MIPLQIEPASADRIDEDDAPWDEYDLEKKWDGWRSLIQLIPGAPRMFITGRSKLDNGMYAEWGDRVPHIAPKVTSNRLIIIDGEIIPPVGVKRAQLAGVIGPKTNPEKSISWIRKYGRPSFRAFDILFAHNDLRNLALTERRNHLTEQMHKLFAGNEFLRQTEVVTNNTRAAFEREIDSGEEGVMLKKKLGFYDGTKTWYKVKRKHDVDVFVTGFTAAEHGVTGKYDGLIGAIECSVINEHGQKQLVAQVSGFSDVLRKAISANPQAYINRVLAIKVQEWAKDKLMSPRFKEWRPELNTHHCTFAKMLADLAANKGRK